MKYPRRKRKFVMKSPWSRECAKRVARRHYPSLAASVATSARTSRWVVMDVCRKMKQEMRHYCGRQGTTIIGSSVEGVENFSFDSLWYEMSSHMPTLTTVLQQLMPKKDFSLNIPVLCLIGSMLLKHRSQNMALLQRVISVFLYGNGASN